MKRSVSLILLFTVLFAGFADTAEGQIWKKIFKKKEQPKRKPAPKKPAAKEKPSVKQSKKREINYPVSQKKERYRIDILTPLYLNELVKGDKPAFKGKLPAKAVQGMEFYEGVKLAADTLTDFGYDIDVYIHDISDPQNAPALLIRNKHLDSSNLVIGAIQSQQVPLWASFAKTNKINFVSALSPSDGDTKDNPYFTLLQPSLETHCEQIIGFINKKYPRQKPILLYRTSVPVDQNAFNYLLNADDDVKQLSCNTLPTKEQLKPLLDSVNTNVLVIGIIDNTYADNLLKQLHTLFPNYRFDVYGMPSWTTLANLKKAGAYPNVAVYLTTPFYFDGSTASGQAVAAMYKKLFGNVGPGEMVYRGYETMFWYAYLLNKYGTIFNNNMSDNNIAPFTRFDIQAQWDKDNNLLYNENQHVYLYRYQDGSYTIEK